MLFLGSLSALVWMGTMRPRRPTVDAMITALAVSLLVNDTPVDVIGLGAVGCVALLLWESVDSRPMRRGVLTAAAGSYQGIVIRLLILYFLIQGLIALRELKRRETTGTS